jgi:DoxX-like family
MNTFAWTIQGLLAFVFLAYGLLFLFPPPAVHKIKKQAPFPAGFMQLIYIAEVLASLGLTLPGLTGILPLFTPLAAAGLVPIMGGAVILHLSRREIPPSVVIAVLLAFAVFVAYARWFVNPL